MSTKDKKHKRVEIEWYDSEHNSADWVFPPKVEKLGTVKSIGYLIHEDKEQIILVQSLDKKNGRELFRLTIPKVCIYNTKELK